MFKEGTRVRRKIDGAEFTVTGGDGRWITLNASTGHYFSPAFELASSAAASNFNFPAMDKACIAAFGEDLGIPAGTKLLKTSLCDCGGAKTYGMISKETCSGWCSSQKA